MTDLKYLSDKVAESIAKQDGTWRVRREMLEAIEELRVTAMGPSEYITWLRYQALQNVGIMMALEMNLLNPVVERKGQTITAEELASTTGSDKLLTVRIMRMLTALRITTEVSLQTYASNANAEYLSHPSHVAAMKFINRPTLKVMANVVPYMRANNGRFLQFPDTLKGETSLAKFTHGMSLWELFRADPEILGDFSAYLSGRREDMVGYWWDIWPAKEKIAGLLEQSADKDRALVVDVGGNVGYDLQAFQRRFPDFTGRGRLVLQELAEIVKNARTLLEGTGIEAMEYDFFTEQPVKGARIYYFGGIFHDWPDADALRILINVAAAMAPDSRIIIDEMALPDEKVPLNLVTYDLLMMVNLSGIERTIGHYKELFEKVGLELVGVWRSSLDSVLEVRLKQ